MEECNLVSTCAQKSKLLVGVSGCLLVSLLSILMAPDKEAVLVFVCFGFYPLLKPYIDRLPLPWLWKALLFNGIIVLLYTCLLRLLGLDALAQEYQAMELGGLIAVLLLGNTVFFLLDLVLGKQLFRNQK